MYKIEVCTSVIQLTEKEKEWKEFEHKTNNTNFNTSFIWIKTFLEMFLEKQDGVFGYTKNPLIIFLYKNDSLIAIAPFIFVTRKKTILKFRFLEFIGQQWAGTILDFIGNKYKKEDIEEIFKFIYKNYKFDVVSLKYIPEKTKAFSINCPSSFILSGCPFINMKEYTNSEEYIAKNYSKGTKQNIRTALNNIAKSENTYETSKYKIDENTFDQIVTISNTKTVDGKGSIYLDSLKKNFVKKILININSDVVFSEINGEKVAYRLNFYYGNNKYCFDAAYDRNLPRKFGLGNLSVHESIKDSFTSSKLNIHTEGVGLDEYKITFMKKTIILYTYIQKGNTILSKLIEKNLVNSSKRIEADIIQEFKKIHANT